MIIDLDGFKELNDTLGHYAGDLVLQQVGPRLQEVVREHEMLARLGGDEFGVIVLDGSAASDVAQRLAGGFRAPFSLADLTVTVQASIGISVFPHDARDADGLLQRADVAMYQAKESRSGWEFYAPARDRHSRQRFALIAELRDAIEQNQLVLEYQPKIDLFSGELHGVEALVRWQHPERGMIPPGEFVPLAEQTGVTGELTTSVLNQAMAQQAKWLATGLQLRIAANISASSLMDATFVDELRRHMAHWRIPPRMFALEITESVLAADHLRTRSVLESIAELGVDISLDDFGTGYSPLSYLKELRVDEMKIDRSFVDAMTTDRNTGTIVASTIDLANRLGIRVVAEGVETAEQADVLRSLGCRLAQGYLFSRPLPAAELERWIVNHAAPVASILDNGVGLRVPPAEVVNAGDGNRPPQAERGRRLL